MMRKKFSDKEKKVLNFEETKDKALRLLEFRSHSEFELKEKLKRAGAVEENIDTVIEFCREYGFINDERYAKGKAAELQKLKKYGKRRIVQELRYKGISSDLIDAAVCELEDIEEDTLYPLVKKKLGGNFEKKDIDKCIRYFMYRGYDFGDIKTCIDRVKSEDGNDYEV